MYKNGGAPFGKAKGRKRKYWATCKEAREYFQIIPSVGSGLQGLNEKLNFAIQDMSEGKAVTEIQVYLDIRTLACEMVIYLLSLLRLALAIQKLATNSLDSV